MPTTGSTTDMYYCLYDSPLGEIIISSDGAAVTGLWFRGQKYEGAGLKTAEENPALPVFAQCRSWLDAYFGSTPLPPAPPLSPKGTEFQQRVWEALLDVPCGSTLSYGELARRLGCKSARAVGGAVGRNPISILIPCHRILGSGGKLTGYAGGLERKKYLLELENIM